MRKNKGLSCSTLVVGLVVLVLLGFFIQYGLPSLMSFYQDTMGLADMTPRIPPTPGLNPDMDELWFYCAINGSEWNKKCDALITDQDELIVYREFGLTCGGRFDNIWGVNCTELIPIVTKAPTEGVPVLPWQNKRVRTLCLVANETYDRIDQDFTPIKNHLERMLFALYYFSIVDDGCDAVLTIEATGTPISVRYIPAGDRYTGAEVGGWMSLAAPENPKLTGTFHGRVDPLEKYSELENQNLYSTPEQAPFIKAVSIEVKDILIEWFGPEIE